MFCMSVDSRMADLVDSCEYAVGGYSEEASAYLASGVDNSEYQLSSATETFPHVVTEGMTDICDMCGHLLPPLSDEHLRQKHIQVQYILTTDYTVTPTLLMSAFLFIGYSEL